MATYIVTKSDETLNSYSTVIETDLDIAKKKNRLKDIGIVEILANSVLRTMKHMDFEIFVASTQLIDGIKITRLVEKNS